MKKVLITSLCLYFNYPATFSKSWNFLTYEDIYYKVSSIFSAILLIFTFIYKFNKNLKYKLAIWYKIK